jgi:hypothetical protein
MLRARWLVLGVLLAVAGGALAVSTVGVPAFLTLQQLSVNGTTTPQIQTVANSGSVVWNVNNNTAASTTQQTFNNDQSNQLLLGLSGSAQGLGCGTNCGELAVSSGNGLCIGTANCTYGLNITAAGVMTGITGTVLPFPTYGDATNVTPRTLSARVSGAAGGCTITNQSGGFSNCTGSTGLYTLTFAHTFSAAPACTTSNENGTTTTQANVAGGVATSQVAVSLVTSAGGTTTGSFDVICMGK